jgi:hypothetical protein
MVKRNFDPGFFVEHFEKDPASRSKKAGRWHAMPGPR